MKYSLLISCLFFVSHLIAQVNVSNVWVADKNNGRFINPVIHADYSDPDAIRVGDDFYMISSSFNHVPGLPILHSTDLVNWLLIGHALQRLKPDSHYSKVRHGNGVWAPSLRHHAGEFFIYYPDPDFGIYMTKAKKITGPWTDPVLVEAGKGLIDPCPLWDDDGRVFLVHAFAGSRAGIKSILVIKEMNTSGTKTIDNGVLVYDGHEKDPTVEGPKFYKRNGYYYIFAPAGGVSTGWQIVLRSKNIYGPYERRVVMDQGETSINGPHQGAWVNTSTGEDWFLHFQDKDAYGRIVHLQPLKWINDWPVIGIDINNDGKGEPVSAYTKPNVGQKYTIETVADSDEFNSTSPGLQWQWQANPQPAWAFPSSLGLLRMYAVFQSDSIINLWNLPNILGQKLPAEEFTARLKVNFKPLHVAERFGFVMLGESYACISIVNRKDGLYIVCSENATASSHGIETEKTAFPVTGNEFYFDIKVDKGGICHFSFAGKDEKFISIPGAFTMKPGRWVGAKLGIFMLSTNKTNDAGFTDVDWLRFELNPKK
jgi:beta-xylosidase